MIIMTHGRPAARRVPVPGVKLGVDPAPGMGWVHPYPGTLISPPPG